MNNLSTLLYGTTEWAHDRAWFYSTTDACIFLVFRVGPSSRDFRFARQLVGTRLQGEVRPISAYKQGRLISDKLPFTVEGLRKELEPLTIPLPWPTDAPPDAVKQSFRRWCKTGHPDVGGDTDTFRAVKQRYDLAVA